MKQQRPGRDWNVLKRYKKRYSNSCKYCGMPRECWDHVLPYSVAASPECDYGYYSADVWEVVACCTLCNSIAGSKAFRSFSEKRAFILARRKETIIALSALGSVLFSR